MTRIHYVRVVLSLLGAGLLLLLGGCVLPSSQQQGVSAQANKAMLAPSVSPAQDLAIFRALELLTQQCMQAKGYKYYTESVDLTNFSRKGDVTDPLYVDAATLRATGYGLYLGSGTGLNGTNAVGVPGSTAEESYVISLASAAAEAYGTALNGDAYSMIHIVLPDGKVMDNQAGGCDGLAYQRLYGSTTKYPGMSYYMYVFTYSYDIYDAVWNAAEHSAPYVSAETRWVSCMRGAGFTYKTRGDAYSDLLNRYHAPHANKDTIHADELKVARADANCVQTAGLNPVSEQQITVAAGNLNSIGTQALRAWNQMDVNAASIATTIIGTQ